jgi:hypothetical protein
MISHTQCIKPPFFSLSGHNGREAKAVSDILRRLARRSGKLTDEDWERFWETRRMLEERIAYHTAKAREEAEAARKSA